MSRLTRILVLGAMLATMTLTCLTAVAQARPTGNDAVELFRQGERASQDQPSSDSVKRAAEAQERYYSSWGYGDPAVEQALAQERYYSTWGYGDTPAPAPAEPSGQPGWLVPAIGVLAGILALLGVLAAMLLRRARGRVRVHQAA
jgi:hypothetical protein